jgi:hypothetical protein
MHTLSIKDAKQLIEHVAVEQREPVMIWGQPGVGKSEMMAQIANDHNAPLVDIRLSQYDSVDLRGLPDRQDGMTVWYPPSTLPFKTNPNFSDEGLIFLFLDEINSAQLSVAAVAYQLVNDKRLGEHELRDNVVIVAAGNREGDKGVTNRMPTPLANRFTHIEIGVDVDAWCEWAQGAGLPAVAIAFYQFRKPLLSTFDPSKPDKAFSTPRTAAKAWRYFASDMPQHVKQAAMAGAIGNGPSAEAWGFIDVWQKIIPVSQIEKDPMGVEVPVDGAMRYAMSVSVSGSMTTKNVSALNMYLNRMPPEFNILAWQLATKRDETLFTTKEFIDFSKKYRAVFQ